MNFKMEKRRILENLGDFIKQNRLPYDEVIEYCQALKKIRTIDLTSVLVADWFLQLLLQYLSLKDIARLDSAICNSNGRPQWLESLQKYISLESLINLAWSDAVINWIILKHIHFEELIITKTYLKISNDGMYRLAQQCPNLERLTIKYDIPMVDDNRLQYLTAMCYKLKTIKLRDGFILSLDDCVWLDACEQLESIQIDICESPSSSANIKALTLKNKKKLKILHISTGLINSVFLKLGTNCPLLEHLNINLPKDTLAAHIEVFTQGCTKLKTLEVCDKYNTIDSPFDFENKLMDGLGKNCPLLENLCIRSSVRPIGDISEAALKSLAQGCPLLQGLHILRARIPSAGVKHLIDHCSMLADIRLVDCTISDDVLVELGKSKSLTRLSVASCHQITDEGIDAFVRVNSSSLKVLNINYCSKLTSASLSSISEHCRDLRTLNVGGKRDLTSVAITRLVQKCEKLIHFNYDYHGFPRIDLSLPTRILEDRRKRMATK